MTIWKNSFEFVAAHNSRSELPQGIPYQRLRRFMALRQKSTNKRLF